MNDMVIAASNINNQLPVEDLSFKISEEEQKADDSGQDDLIMMTAEKTRECAVIILKDFIERISERDDVCMFTTGSDGRGEKIEHTLLELVIVFKEDIDKSLIDKINDVVTKNLSLFDSLVEEKSLKNHTLTYFFDPTKSEKEKQPFYTRGLDASFLGGSLDVFDLYQKSFFSELQNTSKEEYVSQHFFDKKAKDMRKNLKAVIENRSDHIIAEKGIMYYDGNTIKGPKYTLLRTLQYGIADYIAFLIKNVDMNCEQYCQMPKSIVGRIEYLSDNGYLPEKKDKGILLNDKTIEKVKTAYTHSLQWYGECQKKYTTEREKVSVKVDHVQLNSAIDSINSFFETLQKLKKMIKENKITVGNVFS